MSISTELTALQNDITNARTAITNKGGSVTSGGGSSQLATDIATIPTGGTSSIEANKNATPTLLQQAVTPSTGYDAMARVTISAIPFVETDNQYGGKTVTIG